MSTSIDELVALHVQHKYFVLVQKEETGVSVAYPINLIVSPTFGSRVDVYKVSPMSISYTTSDGYKQKIKTAGYDNRLLILTDIVLKTKQKGMSGKLILPFDGIELKKGIVGLIKSPTKKILIDKEKALITKYKEVLDTKGDYDIKNAKEDNILEGFNSIRLLLYNGGI